MGAIALGGLATQLAGAQQSKPARIGLLRTTSPDVRDPGADGLRSGLRELGYIEGQNIQIEYRWAEGRPDRVPDLAADLVRLNVAVIVTGGEQAVLAVKRATSTIQIVMGASNDAVQAGLVASLARPGGNVTGMTILSPDLSRKRLQLLAEALPGISRVAVLSNPAYPGTELELKETLSAAKSLGLALHNIEVRSEAQLAPALEAARARADALLPLGDPFFTAHRVQIARLALKHRLPGVFYWKEFAEAGGLMSYGPNLREMYRRAAWHVDRILKGATPAELPGEQPTRYEFTINLATAKALDLAIAQSVLVRADSVIR
ncbi:MAG TPA: ABC transporter substrate-binding protein [Burkholderiales bacterium]|nr:ABC transporter substrate-binding protein [Burkholderiales bacterium]